MGQDRGQVDPRRRRVRAGRFGALLMLLVASAGIASGCGSSANAAGHEGVRIGFTTTRDQTGIQERIFDECSKASGGKYWIDPIYMPPTVDGQREQLIRRLAGQDPTMNVLSLDVIWTAEFAEAGWIYDLTDRITPQEREFVPAALETVRWKERYWALPVGTNVAVLYYRSDIIKDPPQTWEQLAEQAKEAMASHPGMDGFLWQANQYEGMTVDTMEFIYGANGKVLSDDGKQSLIDEGDGTQHAFEYMRRLFADGITPKQVLTFQEEESRQAFQQGKAVFLRNWPYVYPLAGDPETGSKIVGKFGVVPLPGFKDRSRAGVLGGVNYAISRFSPDPELAFEAASCIGSEKNDKVKMIEKGELSAREASYRDPEVIAAVPFTKVARAALDSAHSRPITPYYNDVTYAINSVGHRVAAGELDPAEGVRQLDRSVQRAIEGKGEI